MCDIVMVEIFSIIIFMIKTNFLQCLTKFENSNLLKIKIACFRLTNIENKDKSFSFSLLKNSKLLQSFYTHHIIHYLSLFMASSFSTDKTLKCKNVNPQSRKTYQYYSKPTYRIVNICLSFI